MKWGIMFPKCREWPRNMGQEEQVRLPEMASSQEGREWQYNLEVIVVVDVIEEQEMNGYKNSLLLQTVPYYIVPRAVKCVSKYVRATHRRSGISAAAQLNRGNYETTGKGSSHRNLKTEERKPRTKVYTLRAQSLICTYIRVRARQSPPPEHQPTPSTDPLSAASRVRSSGGHLHDISHKSSRVVPLFSLVAADISLLLHGCNL